MKSFLNCLDYILYIYIYILFLLFHKYLHAFVLQSNMLRNRRMRLSCFSACGSSFVGWTLPTVSSYHYRDKLQVCENTRLGFLLKCPRRERKCSSFAIGELVGKTSRGWKKGHPESFDQHSVARMQKRNRISLIGIVKNKPVLTAFKSGQKMTTFSLKVLKSSLPDSKLKLYADDKAKLSDIFILQFFDRVAYVVVRRVEEGCRIKVTGRLGGSSDGSFRDSVGSPVLICSSFVLLESNVEQEEELFVTTQPRVVLRKPEDLCETFSLFPEGPNNSSSVHVERQDKSLHVEDSTQTQDNLQEGWKEWSTVLDSAF